MGTMLKPPKLSPQARASFRVAGLYAIAALLWILFSDELLRFLTGVPATYSLLQTIKGSFFVATTATLLYWLGYRHTSAVERYTERLAALREIDKGILNARAPTETAYAALSHMQRLIACQRGGVVLFDFAAQTFTRLAMDLNGEADIQVGKSYPLAAFGDLGALQRGEIMKVDDLTRCQNLSDLDRQLLQEGMRSYIRIPLMVKGELIGSLNLSSDRPRFFSKEHLEIAREVADQLTVAIQQAQLHDDLQESNSKLAEALRAKDEMLQNVSHELRTPLTHIQGYSDLLLDGIMGALSPEQHHALSVIRSRAQILTLLVDDLLTLQSLEKDGLRLGAVALAQVAREVVDAYQDIAKRSGIILKKEWAEDLPWAWGDAERLKQVVRNLVDNAIKFSPDGGEVTVRLWNDEKSLFCSVSDQGIGIAPELQERVFDRFYQVNGSTRRRFGGTGIGLALVRQVVEAHGGRVWVESSGVPGEGSTFTFSIPCLPAGAG